MKKILIMFCVISNIALAGEVLDSEAVDYESEYEGESICSVNGKVSSSSYYFNPTQMGGSYSTAPNWYIINNTMKFIPVPKTR